MNRFSAEARLVFLQNAEVHSNEHARKSGLFGSGLVDDLFLHPYRGNFQLNCLIHDCFHEFRATKNVHDVNLLGDIEYRREGFFPQRFGDSGIYGNNLISLSLHVRRDAVAGAKRIVGESHDGDGACAFE